MTKWLNKLLNFPEEYGEARNHIKDFERFAKDGRNVEKLVDDIKEYSLVKTKKLRPIEYIFDDH
ncbi:MAG TPA: hypothetical protein EYM72_01055, partial [Gammaproteobacteria bacterium]|nr:hypothetical protein [Gammaproteobacteria bacterium]